MYFGIKRWDLLVQKKIVWDEKWQKKSTLRHLSREEMLHKWNLRDNPAWNCGAQLQTISHKIDDCPIRTIKITIKEDHNNSNDSINHRFQLYLNYSLKTVSTLIKPMLKCSMLYIEIWISLVKIVGNLSITPW